MESDSANVRQAKAQAMLAQVAAKAKATQNAHIRQAKAKAMLARVAKAMAPLAGPPVASAVAKWNRARGPPMETPQAWAKGLFTKAGPPQAPPKARLPAPPKAKGPPPLLGQVWPMPKHPWANGHWLFHTNSAQCFLRGGPPTPPPPWLFARPRIIVEEF